MGRATLTFSEVRNINLARSARWHGGKAPWNVADLAVAFGGEAGEVLNTVKKLKRLEDGISAARRPKNRDEAVDDVANEIGDAFLYLDQLAAKIGRTIPQCIVDTFNRVSEREGFPERLTLSGPAKRKKISKRKS